MAANAEIRLVCEELTAAINKVIRSSYFDWEAVVERPLKLSQAYCLLWHDAQTGDVKGRESSWNYELQGGAFATCILDLLALRRISLEVEQKTFMGIEFQTTYIKVLDDTPTNTFLDDVVFTNLIKHHKAKPDKPREVYAWMGEDLFRWKASKNCASLVLDSLVDVGTIRKEKKLFGFSVRYPTADPAPQRELMQEIRKIALEYYTMDSYMKALLTIMRTVDCLYQMDDPLLKRFFAKEEYGAAKQKLSSLTDVRDEKKKANKNQVDFDGV